MTMDSLLLLAPVTRASAIPAVAISMSDDDGDLRRRRSDETAPFIFAGVSINHPRLFADCPMDLLHQPDWDHALRPAVSPAIAIDGMWMHIGTPEPRWTEAERRLHGLNRRLSCRCSAAGRDGRSGHAGGQVFTIPPSAPFLDALARAILDGDLPRERGTPPSPLELAGYKSICRTAPPAAPWPTLSCKPRPAAQRCCRASDRSAAPRKTRCCCFGR